MEEIIKYFPGLSDTQISQFEKLGELYTGWNEKINVVSRKDIDNLYLHHVLHSLAIAKFFTPQPGTSFMDLGCGGGFPGIPLAILWPHCRFHLIDRIAKKLKVASEISTSLGLCNCTFQHGDSSECKIKSDYVISRAVMTLPELVKASKPHLKRSTPNRLPSGLLCLKGGDLSAETSGVSFPTLEIPLSDWFAEDFFATKKLIYVEL